MNVAFVVNLTEPDGAVPDLNAIAADLLDALESAGFDVASINPWNRPSIAPVPNPFTPPPTVV